MATAEQTANQEGFVHALSSFISNNRKVLFFIVLIVLAGLVGLVIVLQVRKNRQEEALVRFEEVQKQFAQWIAARDEAEKEGASAESVSRADSLEAGVVEGAEAVVARYEGLYAQMKASDILASVAFRKKEYEKAAEIWTALADGHAKSYFAPLALLNASAAWEEAGKPDKAADSLTEILTKFSASFPDIPRVLFLRGRLAEDKHAYDEAKTYYDRLIDEYSGSGWTKLAHNRIIFLQIQGKVQK
jgi:predicted negative regulator of RcsB-dependent stress response